MTRDIIVEEVRAARAALLESAGGTLEGLFEYLVRQQEDAGRTSVVLPAKRPDEHWIPPSARPV